MKRNVLLLWLLALLVGFWAGIFYNLDSQDSEGEEILLVHLDDQGDDYGPGTYLYPTHQHFAPHEGLFDLLRFEVLQREEEYQFQITFQEMTNPWRARYGFSHQLIQIYIDNGPGGSTKTLLPGANVVFSGENPWNYLVKASGWGVNLYRPGEDPDLISRQDRLKIEHLEGENTIRILVPREELGSLKDAAYYVLSGSFDVFGPDNYREVQREVGTWYLGGGDDSYYNPNVVDMLTPSHLCQRELLGNWSSQEERLALLYPIGGRPGIQTLLPWAGLLLLFMLVLLLFIRHRPKKQIL